MFLFVKKILKRILRNIFQSRNCFTLLQLSQDLLERESFGPLPCMRNYSVCETFIKLFIMMTILWIIKFSVVVYLCVEISFCWWNWLFLFFFFNLKHQIDWCINYKNIFWEFHLASEVDYYDTIKKKWQQQQLKLLLSQLLPNLYQFSGVSHSKWQLWRYSVLAILLKVITFQEVLC